MNETAGYILAFATLIAAGLFGIVVLPATERPGAHFGASEFAPSRHWLHATA